MFHSSRDWIIILVPMENKSFSTKFPDVQLLDIYPNPGYAPGISWFKTLFWYLVGNFIVQSTYVPWSSVKVQTLRIFGATIGRGVRIKPGVHIKFPWQLSIGDYCWIGEKVWIDNAGLVQIGNNVCLSQGVYLCTGNHDWSDPTFKLKLGSIRILDSAWIAAGAKIGPNVIVGYGSVLTIGSVAIKSLEELTIYSGNPAVAVGKRKTKVI